ncbi:hypothetical protein [Phyllobacterium zundukense]|uniref:Uncharacterized protein n=1 Tax=Phyllobacterium zundukense TaxID=1867719 RepID=A0A2N9VS53_9HYPH|nr:hypothetical protein [Phyllobacterium zundukense]PIO42321.1 hypothetical protein B5P45_25180 [Phyllobacterium zundukense]
MAANEKTGTKAGNLASKVLRTSGTSSKAAKTLAASALSQKPVTKKASISERDADRAVRSYLSHKK